MKKIKLDDIRIDGGTQMREVIDQPTVYSYLEHMKDGDEFPKMLTVFDGATYWLVDGFHRYHAYKLLGTKEIMIDYKPGTLEDAVVLSYSMNANHGKPRSNADKRNAVAHALENPVLKDKSNYEIAKICRVSQSFVAAVRDPEAKERQDENNKRRIVKKAKQIEATTSGTSTGGLPSTREGDPDPRAGEAPDDEEMKLAEAAYNMYIEEMNKIIEADEPLKEAAAKIEQLTYQNQQFEMRIHGLMNERNEAVKQCKKLQKENDKLKGK